MSGERLPDRTGGGMEKKTWILAAVICAVLLGVSAVMFIPVKEKTDETLPAVMQIHGSDEVNTTTLTVNGTWSKQRMGKSAMTYRGIVGSAALGYTLYDGMDDLNVLLTEDLSEGCLMGGFFYNHFYSGQEEGYGWLYTDRERSCYLLVTGLLTDSNDGDEYLIAAPAANAAEARAICEKLGVYPNSFAG